MGYPYQFRGNSPWDINSSGLVGDPTLAGFGIGQVDPMPSQGQASHLDASTPPQTQPTPPAQGAGAQSLQNAMAGAQDITGQDLGVKRGSGRTRSKELQGSSLDKTISMINQLYSPEQMQGATEAWSRLPQFQQQQSDINDQRNIRDLAAMQPMQTDLSPLSRLSDSWFGTKLSQGYEKPQTPQERLASLYGYDKNISNSQNQMTGDIIKAFGDSRAGTVNTLSQLAMLDQLKSGGQDPLIHARPNNFPATNFKSYEKFANDQMGGEKSTEAATELKNMGQLVQDNNNPTGLKELPLRLDKFITGSARISDSQIRMLGGDPAVMNQIEQTIRSKVPELTGDGYLTDKNKAEYLALFQQYADERNKMRQLKARWLTSPSQLAHHGVDSTAGQAAIDPSMVNIYSMPSASSPSGAGGGGGWDPAAVAAEIAKRKAAKGK